MKNLEIGTKYKHYKNKKHIYEIIGMARNSETLEEMVVYRALYDSLDFGKDCLWVRPKAMFLENVDVDGLRGPRFEYIGE